MGVGGCGRAGVGGCELVLVSMGRCGCGCG